MLKTLKKYPILFLSLFVAIMLLPNLDTLQVTIMEARNFITAREMLENDNWILTTMNGEARYQKPPLPTWLSAMSTMVFGIKSIFGMRLPAVFMVMVVGSFMFYLSRSILKSRTHSMVNALIVITSFYVIGITIEAPWDIFAHGFMLIAIYNLNKLFKKEDSNWKATLYAGFFIGLSILCKGPVSIYALLLPFLLAYGFTFKYKHIKSKGLAILSIIASALIIGGWWYLYVRLQDPETFKAITSKETGNWTSYNVRPFYYYWSFFTQSGLWTIPAFISLLYPYLKTRVSHYKAYKFSFLWTVLAVILLSIIPEKKSRYLMPVLIPLAFNIGFYIEYLFRRFKTLKDKRETIPVYFNFGLIALIGIAFPLVSFFILKVDLQNIWFITTSLIFPSIGIFILIQLKQKNIKKVFLSTVFFFAFVFIFGLPLAKTLKSEGYKSISSLKEENELRGLKLYAFNYIAPETIWDYGDIITQIPIKDKAHVFPTEREFGILVNDMSSENEALLREKYSVKEVTTYDLNQAEKGAKQYNKRLFSTYYILTKK